MRYTSVSVVSKKVDSCLVLYKPKTTSFIELNETASFLWDLLSKPISKKSLVNKFIKKYQIDEKNAQEDVEEFLEQMEKANLVQTF